MSLIKAFTLYFNKKTFVLFMQSIVNILTLLRFSTLILIIIVIIVIIIITLPVDYLRLGIFVNPMDAIDEFGLKTMEYILAR